MVWPDGQKAKVVLACIVYQWQSYAEGRAHITILILQIWKPRPRKVG